MGKKDFMFDVAILHKPSHQIIKRIDVKAPYQLQACRKAAKGLNLGDGADYVFLTSKKR